MTPLKRLRHSGPAWLVALAFVLSGPALAAPLPEGFVIDAGNIDRALNQTFEGKTIRSMIYERLEWQVRNHGLKIRLRRSEVVPLDPRYLAATARNRTSGKIKYDPQARKVTGWEAGIPFPDIDVTDPYAANKLIWNHFYAQPIGQFQNYPKFAFLFVDGGGGLERVQHWRFQRYFMKGCWGDKDGDLVKGDGRVFMKTLLYATYPFDIKGIGTFTIKYDSPKLEDTWAYLRSVRRVRRLSGGTWMDPIGGTDQLNDDIEIFNAHPTWYPEYKLLGKRWILATAHSRSPTWDEKASNENDEFRNVDFATPPYWNPDDDWEPRQVWVIEAITPPEHPYSKKILYMETKFPRVYHAEVYDRKGQFWKFLNFLLRPHKGADGSNTVVSAQGHTIDFQRNHATIFISHPSWKTNTPEGPQAVTLGVLEKEAGR